MADDLRQRVEVVVNAEQERRELKRAFDWYQQQHRRETEAHPATAAPGKKDERSASELRAMKSYVQGVLKRYFVAPAKRAVGTLGPTGQLAGTAATTPPSKWFGNIRAFVAGWITANMLEPLGLFGQIVGGTLIAFARPLVGAAMGALKAPFSLVKWGAQAGMAFGPVGAIVGGAVGLGAGIGAAVFALKYVLMPLFNLGMTLKLASTTFGWSQEYADEQIRIIGRTRRTFPGLIGEAFEQAQDTMRTKLSVASALFGGTADAMMEGFNRRLQMASRGGAGGQRDVFYNLGLTRQSVRAYEEIIMGGQRMTLTDWLYLFIRKREELESKIADTPEGSAARADIGRRKAKLLDSALQLFGQDFSEMAGIFTTGDWQKLTDNIEAANPLAKVANAAQNTRRYTVALGTMRETFSQLKRGIVGDVMPKITDMMEKVRTWLVSTTSDGQTMGMKFRKLATALAVHAWETLAELLKLVKPEDVKAFIDPIKKWEPGSIQGIVEKTVVFLEKLAGAITLLTEWISGIINWATNIKKYGVIRGTWRQAVETWKEMQEKGPLGMAKDWEAGVYMGTDRELRQKYGPGTPYAASAGRAAGFRGGGGTEGGAGATGGYAGGGIKEGTVTGGGGVRITGGKHSSVDPTSLYTSLVGKFRQSKLVGYVPPDGAKFGIVTGSAEEWARLGTALAGTESGYKANPPVEYNPRVAAFRATGGYNPQGAAGLYQFSAGDLNRRGLGKDVTNVEAQMTAMIRELEKSKTAGGLRVHYGGLKYGGGAAHFGPIRATEEDPMGRRKALYAHLGRAEKYVKAAGAVPIGAPAGVQVAGETLDIQGGGKFKIVGGNTQVDPRLLRTVAAAAQNLGPGHTVEMFSGRRSNDPRSTHYGGQAIDVQIRGPDGQVIRSRGTDPTGKYQQLARLTYGEMLTKHPDLAQRMSWGGSFGTRLGGGGEADLMHFDVRSSRGGRPGYFRRIQNIGPLYAKAPVAPPPQQVAQAAPPEAQPVVPQVIKVQSVAVRTGQAATTKADDRGQTRAKAVMVAKNVLKEEEKGKEQGRDDAVKAAKDTLIEGRKKADLKAEAGKGEAKKAVAKAEADRKTLTEKPPEQKEKQAGKDFGDAAGEAFNNKVKDTKVAIKSEIKSNEDEMKKAA